MKVKPYYPLWSEKRGSKVIRTWDEPVKSGDAEGIVTKVEFINAKGSKKVMVKWVKWLTS